MYIKYKLSFFIFVFFASSTIYAAPISGLGTWESTLIARDLDGDTSTAEAYYDTELNITWLADANAGAGSSFDNGSSSTDGEMTWVNAMDWVASLDINGVNEWRLPTLSSVTGGSFDTSFSNNASTDFGTADATGWVDTTGNPVSELGHMFYVTLGNLGSCVPNSIQGTGVCEIPSGSYGLSNTALFSNLVSSPPYWTDTLQTTVDNAWFFNNNDGTQTFENLVDFNPDFYAWAVHSGDVGAAMVPIPAAAWLFGSGFIGLIGIARRKTA